MSVLIDQTDADKLIQELISYTGESAPEAITRALQERLEREKSKRTQHQDLAEQILRIGRECASLPILDDRSADEILGYNEQGLPN
jgi:antitoxin VapB